MLVEPHSHLYGCLLPEDLEWLAGRNQPRWQIFEDAYRLAYPGQQARISDLFLSTKESRRLLESYYYFREAGNFARFQSCFSLIIAVSSTDPEELSEVIGRVAKREPADWVEYRMQFSPLHNDEAFAQRVVALAEGAARAQSVTKKTIRIAISLLRDDDRVWSQYEIVRAIMSRNPAAGTHISGLDFCSVEEGHPPSKKAQLFERILADNRTDPKHALAILYHVGESFVDKSVESAVRWVVEAARLGAARLGHCLALGMRPESFLGTERMEIPGEHLAQIDFELAHADELQEAGIAVDKRELRATRAALAEAIERGADAPVAVRYDQGRVSRLRAFQDWAMRQVAGTGAIVECCPTSNLFIGALGDVSNHPLPRFLASRLRVVLGADDPGILGTDLLEEYELVQHQMGLGKAQIDQLRENAVAGRSELLSGRGITERPAL